MITLSSDQKKALNDLLVWYKKDKNRSPGARPEEAPQNHQNPAWGHIVGHYRGIKRDLGNRQGAKGAGLGPANMPGAGLFN